MFRLPRLLSAWDHSANGCVPQTQPYSPPPRGETSPLHSGSALIGERSSSKPPSCQPCLLAGREARLRPTDVPAPVKVTPDSTRVTPRSISLSGAVVPVRLSNSRACGRSPESLRASALSSSARTDSCLQCAPHLLPPGLPLQLCVLRTRQWGHTPPVLTAAAATSCPPSDNSRLRRAACLAFICTPANGP